MTDDAALARRRALPLASKTSLSAPALTAEPATAEQLRMGWPLIWGTPEADLRAWAIAAEADPAITPDIKVAVAAVLQAATAETAAALADAYDRAVESDAAADLDRHAWCEAADRTRILAGLMGHIPSALLAAHMAEYAGMDSPDDWERRATLTTASELRLIADHAAQGASLRHRDRATTRAAAWADLVSMAELVSFWDRLERDGDHAEQDAEPPAGPVRDDTGWDPREEPDEPAKPTLVVFKSRLSHLPLPSKASRERGESPRALCEDLVGVELPLAP